MTWDSALIQKCVALMVKFLALEAARGGTLKDLASFLSKCTTFCGVDFLCVEYCSSAHVHTGGPTIRFLKETGFRETDKEGVSAGEKVWVLEAAWLGFKSLTSGRKLTFPEQQLCADGETEAQRK